MSENNSQENSIMLSNSMPTDIGGITVATREQTEIQSAIVIAKKFPRNEFQAHKEILEACKRPGLASDAIYKFPRGKTKIEGPSVDLARAIAIKWKNIRSGLRILSVDDEYIHIKGYAIDLESNTSVELEDKFKKLIQRKNSDGDLVWIAPDERDLRELVNRRAAILIRNAILQLIPRDIVDDAIKEAKSTMAKAASGKLETNRDDYIRTVVKTFSDVGVSVEMLEAYLGHELKLVTAEEIVDLKSIHKSIKEGNSKREEHFSMGQQDPTNLNERVAAQQENSK